MALACRSCRLHVYADVSDVSTAKFQHFKMTRRLWNVRGESFLICVPLISQRQRRVSVSFTVIFMVLGIDYDKIYVYIEQSAEWFCSLVIVIVTLVWLNYFTETGSGIGHLGMADLIQNPRTAYRKAPEFVAIIFFCI